MRREGRERRRRGRKEGKVDTERERREDGRGGKKSASVYFALLSKR